jgi:choline dehydrogenase
MQTNADIIIIGGGSAGCVLAERLSADPALRVMLIEAGHGTLKPLHAFAMLTGHFFERPEDNWSYHTVPQRHMADRTVFWPRGKRLGGSSIFNGMVYARGNPGDYDHWAQLGNRGWSWDEVLPYFRRNERHEDGASPLHGGDGLLSVTHARTSSVLVDAFVQAGIEAGFPHVTDFNGPSQTGVGLYDFNIRKGRRSNSARALLERARRRPNLAIVADAQVTRVLFDGRRAIGVEFRRDGQLVQVRAEREVVLSAGAIGTPHLLMLSGVGPAEHLAGHGIAPVHALPGVGENLVDHLDIFVRSSASRPVSLLRELRVDRMTIGVARALLFGSGVVTHSPIAAGGYFHSRPGLDHPDLQAFFMPIGERIKSVWWPMTAQARHVARSHGFALRIGPIRPLSRGRITLAAADPDASPLIDPNYLDDPADLEAMVKAIAIARTIFAQPALRPYLGEELSPGAEPDLARYIRQNAGTVYHPVGTARMGSDPMAVVDERLRVHGLGGLRIADASIMPTIPSGNTNAPTMMVAEKAADMIAADLKT